MLNLWKQRHLSFLGRALIVHVLGASRFYHVAKIISPPNSPTGEAQFKFRSFIYVRNGIPMGRLLCYTISLSSS